MQQQPENTIAYRVDIIEREVAALKLQLERYVPVRENELQLKSIRDTVERIERDVQEAKRQIGDVNTKLVTQETESQRRDNAQRESQSALQIRVLWFIVSTVIVILTGVLVAYATHTFFH